MDHINKVPTAAPGIITKADAKKQLLELNQRLAVLQNLFYAEGKRALLIVLQGMDTCGKDGTVRHVFYSLNPQGCKVKSFKSPTEEERSHDFLWRISANLPEKRMIQIFNRSHYEDVLFPVVHNLISEKIVKERFTMINQFERYIQNNGIIVLKFFLHISKKEQSKRIKERLTNPEKNWKYSVEDKKEARRWNEYMDAYQNIFEQCSESAPWIIVPADDKWYRNYYIANSIVTTLDGLDMKYPLMTL